MYSQNLKCIICKELPDVEHDDDDDDVDDVNDEMVVDLPSTQSNYFHFSVLFLCLRYPWLQALFFRIVCPTALSFAPEGIAFHHIISQPILKGI